VEANVCGQVVVRLVRRQLTPVPSDTVTRSTMTSSRYQLQCSVTWLPGIA
jgi:hypothetical protein